VVEEEEEEEEGIGNFVACDVENIRFHDCTRIRIGPVVNVLKFFLRGSFDYRGREILM